VLVLTLCSCGEAGGSSLSFSDDFDGSSLDRSKWGTGWADSFSKPTHFLDEQISVADGTLRIAAEPKETPSGRPYAGGLVQTKDSFAQRYGRFEARMKVPAGRGLWSALWLLPKSGEWPPEIDILENVGQDPKKAYETNHWMDGGAHRSERCVYDASRDLSDGFHTYSLDWSPDALVWKIDGKETCRKTSNTDHGPMYLIIDLAVGFEGDPGDWVSMPDDSTSFPAAVEVDWVRAYRMS
jgi:beta-glucanase (GH16 family)